MKMMFKYGLLNYDSLFDKFIYQLTLKLTLLPTHHSLIHIKTHYVTNSPFINPY